MKNVRNAAIIAAFVLGGGALAGCAESSTTANDTGGQSEVVVEGVSAEAASLVVEEFFREGASFSLDDYEEMNTAIDASGLMLDEGDTPVSAVGRLSEENMKKFSEEMMRLNPADNLVDYDGLNDGETAVLNMMLIFMNSTMSEEIMGVKLTPSFPVEGVEVEGDTAVANLKYLEVLEVSEDQSGADTVAESKSLLGEEDKLFLKTFKGSWKIDGKETLNFVEELFAKVSAGPSEVEVDSEEFVIDGDSEEFLIEENVDTE